MVWDKPYSTPDWRPKGGVDRGVVLHASPSIKALGTVPTEVGVVIAVDQSGALGCVTRFDPSPCVGRWDALGWTYNIVS